MLGHANFNRTIVLTDTAYTIAMAIRQMESYGVSSINFTKSMSPISNAAYGVYFKSSMPTTYYEIGDISKVTTAETGGPSPTWCPSMNPLILNTPEAKPGNCVYDGVSEQLASFNIGAGYSITDLCGVTSFGSYCTSSTSLPGSLNIVFMRPNTQTILTGYLNGVAYHLSTACIKLSSPDGATSRMIKVTNLGQVTVTTDTTCS